MNELLMHGVYSAYFIYAVVSLAGGVAMFRLSLIRRASDLTLEVPLLTPYQWLCASACCFIHAFRDITELFLGFSGYTIPGIPQKILTFLLALSFLFLFEVGRKYFSSKIGPWVYLFFVMMMGYGMTLSPEACEGLIRIFIVIPASVLVMTAILRRLHALNIYSVQLKSTAFLLGIYALIGALSMPPSDFFYASWLNSQTFLTWTGIPSQIVGAVLSAAIAVLVLDHYGVVRDRIFNYAARSKRLKLRRFVMIFSIGMLVVGAVTSDALSVRAIRELNDTVYYAAYKISERMSLNPALPKVDPHNMSLLREINPFIEYVRLFYRADEQWVYLDNDGHIGRYSAYHDCLNRFESQQEVKPVWDGFSLLMRVPKRPNGNQATAILCISIKPAIQSEVMMRQCIFGFLITLLSVGLLAFSWFVYASTQERRVLVSGIIQQFNQLFRESPVIEMLVDPVRNIIIDANACADMFFSYPPGGLKFLSFSNLHLDAMTEKHSEADPRHVDGETLYQYHKPNGDIRYLRLRSWPVHVQGESLMFCIFDDQTGFVLEEEKLQDNISDMQTLFDTIPIPVYLKSGDGVYLMCNDLFAEFLGFSKSEVIGRHQSEVWPGSMLGDIISEDDQLREEKDNTLNRIRKHLVFPNGKCEDVIFSRKYFPWKNDSGAILGAFIKV